MAFLGLDGGDLRGFDETTQNIVSSFLRLPLENTRREETCESLGPITKGRDRNGT